MAKTQIGAVIGIEGAKQYINDLKNLAQYTKEWKSETDMLTSSFDKNFKSMKNVNDERDALQRQINSLTRELDREQKEWDDYITNMNAFSNTDKQQVGMSELRTKINETQVELNNLNNRMKELPVDNFTGNLKLIKENIEKSDTAMKFWGDTLSDIGGKMSLAFTLPIVGGFTASVKAATDWESAINGVRKTTDMSETELDALGTQLKSMALETTYSSTELANLAQIAGQLGVRGTEDLTKFVGVVSDLGISTDLSAEDAATALARIFNITEGGNLDNLEKIGDVIVHLGNNMATTEPEIVAMANRMASAGKAAGLSTQDIFALSGALTSVGITAEAGGSTVGQVLSKIEKDFAEWTATGEGDLVRIAELSGMSAQDFANAWKDEPIKAFEAFVTGLGNMDEDSENLVLVLDELGMAGIRESNMLKALAAAQEEGIDTTQLFSKALELTSEAYKGVNADGEEFNALQQEADVRKGETATAFSNLAEAVTQLGQAMGESLLPVVTPVVNALTGFFESLSKMDESTKTFVITILGLVASIGPVLAIVGKGLQLFNGLSIAAQTLNITTGALALTMGKWVLIGAAVVVAIGAIVAIIQWCREHSELLMGIWDNLKTWAEEKWNAITNVINAFGEAFQTLWELVSGLFGLAKEFIGNWLSEQYQKFQNWVENLRNRVDNGFRNMVQGVKNKFTDMRNAVENIRNQIDSTFRNLVSSAMSWGRDLIGNMISGIKSKISSLINSVKNVASTIWSYLHFSEPEKGALKDFHTWMPDMMQGMAQGIYDNMYLVDRAAATVADSLGMGGNTSYNYGGVVINLNVPQGTNGYQLVDQIEDALAQRTVRRRAVFG